MWCPSCGAEYRPGFTRCPDCDVGLVDEPPPEPEVRSERAVRAAWIGELDRLGPTPAVVYVGSPPQAELIRALLEGSGVDCVVWRSGVELVYGAIQPNRVAVAAQDEERATELIEAARVGELDLDPTLGPWNDPDDEPDRDFEIPESDVVYAGTAAEAEVIRATLQAQGIEAGVAEPTDGPGAGDEVWVHVPTSDVAGAHRVLGMRDAVNEATITAASSDPITEVQPWWRHPELPQLLSAARVVLALGIVVGVAYLILRVIAG